MIIFAHGLEGSPNGSKIRALRNAGFDVVAPDFQGMNLAERVDLLEEICMEYTSQQPVLAGSSYGGLTAAIIAMKMPDAFRGLLLCAPALHLVEPPVDENTVLVAPNGLKTVIIHGLEDDIVPITCSIDYASRSGNDVVAFHQVNDGHRLAESHEEIIGAAQLLSGETIDS
ncbi:MAG: alpha/beta hydrolase [Candidatus Poseidoniaceae archaeon]